MKNTVSFPYLNLSFELDRVAFSLFGKNVYWYGIIIGVGIILAVLYAFLRRKKFSVTEDNIFDFLLIGLPCALIGARLVYVIGDPDIRTSFLDIISVWNGGLSIYGALSFAVLGVSFYIRKKGLGIIKMLDFASPCFMIGQIIGRMGNFVNVEVYGRETDFFLGMSINSLPPVHPLFLYEMLFMLLGFIITIFIEKKLYKEGRVISFYLVWYGAGRIFTESLRNSKYVLRVFNLPLSVIFSVLFIISGITIFFITRKKAGEENER